MTLLLECIKFETIFVTYLSNSLEADFPVASNNAYSLKSDFFFFNSSI